MKYSFIIPVYNRPGEVNELLESLTRQTHGDFEVIVVEDGSTVTCAAVVQAYVGRLDVHYMEQANAGPAAARNYGASRARGAYFVFLDSDVVLPTGYVAALDAELERPCDVFGGPDRAHADFTPMQKAINYAMTSFFTTGGIRGGMKDVSKFHPRSFNMGLRREVFEALGGFAPMRFGEDVDLSMRVAEGGYSSRLFPAAWVWHKRRTDLRKFFRQVHNSGIARIHLSRRHPGSLKLVHLLPAVFTVGVALLALLFVAGAVTAAVGLRVMQEAVGYAWPGPGAAAIRAGLIMMAVGLGPLLLFALLLFVDATVRNRSAWVGYLAVAAAVVQLTGYGSGFIRAWWRCVVRGGGEFEAFRHNFYQ